MIVNILHIKQTIYILPSREAYIILISLNSTKGQHFLNISNFVDVKVYTLQFMFMIYIIKGTVSNM